jgi:hypothetical protein
MELVQKLAEWGTSDVFADALDAWMNERCTIFDRASNEDGSQPLDWGAAFAQYNDWLDSQLAKFCESVGAGAEEVSAAIAKSLEVGGSIARVVLCQRNEVRRLQDGRETEFFPEFMRCTEYDEFLAQMQKRAQKTKSLATSRTKSSKSSSDEAIKPYDISGVWKADKSKYDADAYAPHRRPLRLACPFSTLATLAKSVALRRRSSTAFLQRRQGSYLHGVPLLCSEDLEACGQVRQRHRYLGRGRQQRSERHSRVHSATLRYHDHDS